MANPFRDMSVIMQGLVAVALAFVVVLVGLYVPFSPVAQERTAADQAVQARTKLNQEVTQLQVYKQRYGELKQQMDALNKQLDTLKTIVPEEKEVDEFIRQIQGAASASNVSLRRSHCCLESFLGRRWPCRRKRRRLRRSNPPSLPPNRRSLRPRNRRPVRLLRPPPNPNPQ